MGKSAPSPPKPPNPQAVAAAQTGSNIETALANNYLGNIGETSPFGSVSYSTTGFQDVGGHQIPLQHRTVTLSPSQQALYDQQTALGSQMNNLASSQLSRLSGVLGQPISTNGLPRAVHELPGYTTRLPNAGPIQRSVNLSQTPTTFKDVGDPVRTFADVGGPQRDVGPQDWSADRQRVEEALMSRLNPQLDRDRANLETTLVNQGLTRGTTAFNQAMDEANRQATDARMQAILAGGQEQSRLAGLDFQQFGLENQAQGQAYDQELGRGTFYNQGQGQNFGQELSRAQYLAQTIAQNNEAKLAAANFANTAQNQQFGQGLSGASFGNQAILNQAQFANTARERALQEMLSLRNQPINEISALMSGGQVTAPQFTQYRPASVEPTPIGQYMYNSAQLGQNAWAQQAANNAASMGGLYGLGAAALRSAPMWSDRRLKTDIVPLYEDGRGLTVYRYRYLDDSVPRIGYMADEVEKVVPEAVYDIAGFKAVDYAKVA